MTLQRLFVALSLAAVALGAPGKRASVTSCLQSAGVAVDLANTTAFSTDGTAYNLRMPIQPAAIAVPTTVDQIAAAVRCGIQHCLPVSAKGGGHSYTSLGFGGEDGHLMIELDRMFDVQLDPTTNIAKVQPGARLGHVANEIMRQGQRALSHGTCPGVGVSGHALHGGYGMVSHKHGLAQDWLVGATAVLANGTVVHCSETEHADLFWALRGAGASFAIVAELEFDTFPAPEQMTVFSASMPVAKLSADEVAQAFLAIQDFIHTSPAELTFQVAMSRDNGYSLDGAYIGDEASLRKVFAPLLEKVGGAIGYINSTTNWLDFVHYYSGVEEGGSTDITTADYAAHDNFYASSLVVPALDAAPWRAFAEYVASVGLTTDTSQHIWFVQIDSLGGQNSGVSAVANDATAFGHRDKLLLFQLYDYVVDKSQPYPDTGIDFVTGFRTAITNSLAAGSWGMYVNYPDSQITAEEAQSLYWGDNLARLRQIKGIYDPNNVFRNPQSIQVE